MSTRNMKEGDLDLHSAGGTAFVHRKCYRLQQVTCLRRLQVGLLATCLILSLVLAVLALRPDRIVPSRNQNLPCTSKSCIAASYVIQSSMDASVDPCEDMYEYACGGWLKSTSIPEGSSQLTRLDEVHEKNLKILKKLISSNATTLGGKESTAIKKLKTFYNSCMNEKPITPEDQGITEILQLIDKLGSWTVSTGSSVFKEDTIWTLQHSLEQIHKLVRYPLFYFEVSADPKNTRKHILTFTQSGLTLSLHRYGGSDAQKYRDAVLDYATQVAVLLGGWKRDARARMNQVYEFENKLAQIFIPKEKQIDPNETYNKMTIGQFQTLIGNWMNVKEYLNIQFQGLYNFTLKDEIIVNTPGYFEKLGPIINETNTEVLANYMMWHVVHRFIEFLPYTFNDAHHELSATWTSVTSRVPRWKTCLGKANAAMGFASGALYVEETLSTESKTRVETILRGIKKAFIDNLAAVAWLDDITRSKIREKAEFMDLMVGYPDWILDVEKLDGRYAKLRVEPGQFFLNKISSIECERDLELDKYTKEPDRFEWEANVVQVDASYKVKSNVLYICAGILQPPVYSPDYPDAYVYGTLGTIVGHELTHGFDNRGRHHDKQGNLVDDMWTKEAEKGFSWSSDCMRNHYSNYFVDSYQLNGTLTLEENIADNGGLRLAYQAFMQKKAKPSNLPGLDLTDEQLFYLGFSQLWCAKTTKEGARIIVETSYHAFWEARVTGPLINDENAARAFYCPFETPLNPGLRCRVW